jgi:hypothetical protein
VTRGCDAVLSSHSGPCHAIEHQSVNLETRDTPARKERQMLPTPLPKTARMHLHQRFFPSRP